MLDTRGNDFKTELFFNLKSKMLNEKKLHNAANLNESECLLIIA